MFNFRVNHIPSFDFKTPVPLYKYANTIKPRAIIDSEAKREANFETLIGLANPNTVDIVREEKDVGPLKEYQKENIRAVVQDINKFYAKPPRTSPPTNYSDMRGSVSFGNNMPSSGKTATGYGIAFDKSVLKAMKAKKKTITIFVTPFTVLKTQVYHGLTINHDDLKRCGLSDKAIDHIGDTSVSLMAADVKKLIEDVEKGRVDMYENILMNNIWVMTYQSLGLIMHLIDPESVGLIFFDEIDCYLATVCCQAMNYFYAAYKYTYSGTRKQATGKDVVPWLGLKRPINFTTYCDLIKNGMVKGIVRILNDMKYTDDSNETKLLSSLNKRDASDFMLGDNQDPYKEYLIMIFSEMAYAKIEEKKWLGDQETIILIKVHKGQDKKMGVYFEALAEVEKRTGYVFNPCLVMQANPDNARLGIPNEDFELALEKNRNIIFCKDAMTRGVNSKFISHIFSAAELSRAEYIQFMIGRTIRRHPVPHLKATIWENPFHKKHHKFMNDFIAENKCESMVETRMLLDGKMVTEQEFHAHEAKSKMISALFKEMKKKYGNEFIAKSDDGEYTGLYVLEKKNATINMRFKGTKGTPRTLPWGYESKMLYLTRKLEWKPWSVFGAMIQQSLKTFLLDEMVLCDHLASPNDPISSVYPYRIYDASWANRLQKILQNMDYQRAKNLKDMYMRMDYKGLIDAGIDYDIPLVELNENDDYNLVNGDLVLTIVGVVLSDVEEEDDASIMSEIMSDEDYVPLDNPLDNPLPSIPPPTIIDEKEESIPPPPVRPTGNDMDIDMKDKEEEYGGVEMDDVSEYVPSEDEDEEEESDHDSEVSLEELLELKDSYYSRKRKREDSSHPSPILSPKKRQKRYNPKPTKIRLLGSAFKVKDQVEYSSATNELDRKTNVKVMDDSFTTFTVEKFCNTIKIPFAQQDIKGDYNTSLFDAHMETMKNRLRGFLNGDLRSAKNFIPKEGLKVSALTMTAIVIYDIYETYGKDASLPKDAVYNCFCTLYKTWSNKIQAKGVQLGSTTYSKGQDYFNNHNRISGAKPVPKGKRRVYKYPVYVKKFVNNHVRLNTKTCDVIVNTLDSLGFRIEDYCPFYRRIQEFI